MHKMQHKCIPFFFFFAGPARNPEQITLAQIDYLHVAGTVCAVTLIYGRLLSHFAIHTARSKHTCGKL